jgi:hypothetical protein
VSAAGVTLAAASPGASSIVMTVTGGAISAATAVTITLAGFILGLRTFGGSINVQTSADPLVSFALSSGEIFGTPVLSSFSMAAADRVAGKTSAAATFSFSQSLGAPLFPGGTITLSYPQGFFASGTITAQVSAAGVTLVAASPGASSIVMTVSGSYAISAANSVTVTVAGFTMGNRTVGGDVTLQTSNDRLRSVAKASGAIFAFAASNVEIDLNSQIIQKSGVSMVLKFTAPFANQSITDITMSGLSFGAPLSSSQPSALCSVDNFVTFSQSKHPLELNVSGVQARMGISLEVGLPIGSGPFGVGTLSITCRIWNLVNSPLAGGSTPSVSLFIFENDSPLYAQSGIVFPALFVQSLGSNRPRVSCF